MAEMPEDVPEIELLRRFNYTVEYRKHAETHWVCLISSPTEYDSKGAEERFEGFGADELGAFRSALGALAPSRITRRLLQRAASELLRESSSEHRLASPERARDLAAILEDLRIISSRVEAGIPEAALMAPPLQKLHVLAWIARARALEQESERDRTVSDATGVIARRLTALCKTWWPGSVRALQVDATPERAAREQGLAPAVRWIEVAESAEARLEQMIAEPSSDEGWRDSSSLSPRASRPQRELMSAIRVIEARVGPIDAPPKGEPRSIDAKAALQLEEAAAKLRWIRSDPSDPERWGAAIGRLRWLVAQRQGGARLARLVDSTFVARPNWQTQVQQARARFDENAMPNDTAPPPHAQSAAATEFSEYEDRIFQAVRERLPNATALLVGRRAEPALQEHLSETLAWQVEWTRCDAQRLESIVESIERGRYRVVLNATALQDHATDVALARAALRSGASYVRINGERVAACARALARELELDDRMRAGHRVAG